MSRFDATQGSQISQKISEVVERPQVGRVVEVFEHTFDNDTSNFELDIRLHGMADKQLRAVPWQSNQSNEVRVPKVGDKVVVEYRGKSKKTPIARNAVHTNEDRPPKATAGVWRRKIESDTSPAGDGDLYVETKTEYAEDAAKASFDPDSSTVENSWVRVAKKDDDLDSPTLDQEIPVMFELFDDPNNDEAHIKLELNQVDGSSTDNTWGIVFDVKTGEFKLLDGDGYGIASDGSGNFTWNYETINYSQGTTDSL
jgi:hypothetical protein